MILEYKNKKMPGRLVFIYPRQGISFLGLCILKIGYWLEGYRRIK